MKLPRNVSGEELVKSLRKVGYELSRQKGSHIRLSCQTPNGMHHITVPNHNPIKVGTLSGVLNDISRHQGISREEMIDRIFG